MNRPGYKTSEFYLTLAANIAALLGTVSSVIPPQYAAIAVAISNGLYAISRGFAKSV